MKKDFPSYDEMMVWIGVLKEIKAKKIRKWISDEFNNFYELK